jgi:UDPglucose 6-dehydrogenase
MRVAVLGLWHLGNVTAACLASAGHQVTAIDENAEIISGLAEGKLPVEEPRLNELIQAGLRNGNLRLSPDLHDVSNHDVLWITFDTPVDEDDIADTDYVFQRALAALPLMSDDSFMLVSSQLPVGTIAKLCLLAGEFTARQGDRMFFESGPCCRGRSIRGGPAAAGGPLGAFHG